MDVNRCPTTGLPLKRTKRGGECTNCNELLASILNQNSADNRERLRDLYNEIINLDCNFKILPYIKHTDRLIKDLEANNPADIQIIPSSLAKIKQNRSIVKPSEEQIDNISEKYTTGGFTSQVQHWDKEQELMKIQRAERKI